MQSQQILICFNGEPQYLLPDGTTQLQAQRHIYRVQMQHPMNQNLDDKTHELPVAVTYQVIPVWYLEPFDILETSS